jgi:hypothetical protein
VANGFPVLFASLLNLFFLLVLMVFAGLREVPAFWTNAGGWPLWFRDLVAIGFYPMFLFELALLGLLSFSGVHLARAWNPVAGVTIVLLPFAWLMLVSVMVLVGFNNLENLVAGRPLHWHPPLSL